MQVILTDSEFKQAISCWLTNKGFDVLNYDITVKVTVGRGDNAGTKAEVDMNEKVLTPISFVSTFPTVSKSYEVQDTSVDITAMEPAPVPMRTSLFTAPSE